MSDSRVPVATALGSYAYAWQQFKKHFLYLFLVALITTVANVPNWFLGNLSGEAAPQIDPAGQILVMAYTLLILSVVKYGAALMYLRYMRDQMANIGDMFSGFKNNYLSIVLANLLVAAIVIMGFILLIVPGIVFAIRLAFVPYLVMDKRLEPVAAVEKSWNMTRGHGWAIFRMGLLAIPIFFAGLLLLGVGAFFAGIWIYAAIAAMYHAVDLAEQQELDRNGGWERNSERSDAV